VLVLDAAQPLNRQDARIADLILQSGAAAVIAANKWDLVEKDTNTAAHWKRELHATIPFLTQAPVEFVSARTAQRVSRVPEACLRVYEAARREIPTSEWNAALGAALEKNPPSAHRGQRPARFYYATQIRTAPPTVALFVSEPARVSESYLRYLNGAFRGAFGFEGSPIRLVLRKS